MNYTALDSNDHSIISVLAENVTQATERIGEELQKNPSRMPYYRNWVASGSKVVVNPRIEKDDHVLIMANPDKFQGKCFEGSVLSAKNYGSPSEPKWYIELHDNLLGYVYWKQDIDGGTLLRVNSHPIA